MTYKTRRDGASAVVIGPDGAIEARHYPYERDSGATYQAAKADAARRNRIPVEWQDYAEIHGADEARARAIHA
jgi:hypothetical protein